MAVASPRKTHIEIEPPITVRSLSEAIGVKAQDLLRKLMAMNQMVTINASLDDELAVMLAMEFGSELVVVHPRTAEDEMLDAFSTTEPRKTSSFGRRSSRSWGTSTTARRRFWTEFASPTSFNPRAAASPSTSAPTRSSRTAGPSLSSTRPATKRSPSMRARGANVTDIVVLVVAADDGVMPQTIEAIAHAKAASVPIVVALNKIDLPNVDSAANINKIYGELSQQGLHPAEWGGETEVVKTSATSGLGIPDLLTTLETIAELHELKADPTRPATGTCLEASLSEGRGRPGFASRPRRDPSSRRRDRLRRRLRPRPRHLQRQGQVDRRGRAVHPGRSLGPGRRTHRRRELRRRRRHSPRPRSRRGSPHSCPRRWLTPTARPSRSKTSTPRWPSRSSRA